MNSQFSENTLGERKIGRFKDLSYFKKARLNLATGLATLKWSKGDKAWSGNRVNKSDPHRLPIATCKDFLLMSWSPCLGVMERFGGLWRTSSLLGRGGLPVLAHHRASHYSKKLKLQLYRHKSVTTDWMKHKCTTCPRKWIFFQPHLRGCLFPESRNICPRRQQTLQHIDPIHPGTGKKTT